MNTTMTDKPNDLLLLAGKILTIIMQAIMAVGAVVLVILTPIVILMQDKINTELVEEIGTTAGAFPLFAVLGLFATAFTMAAAAFVLFGKLRAIIATVGEGDPFNPENADRLSLMAWLMLGLQIVAIPAMGLALVVAKWADQIENSDVTVDAGLDLTGVLMVIILFILARVFKHGAAMREDLEGTV